MTFEFSRSVELTRMWQASLPSRVNGWFLFSTLPFNNAKATEFNNKLLQSFLRWRAFIKSIKSCCFPRRLRGKFSSHFPPPTPEKLQKFISSWKRSPLTSTWRLFSLLCLQRRQISLFSKKIQSGTGRNCKTIVSKRRAKETKNGSTIIGLRNEICLSSSHATSQQLMAKKTIFINGFAWTIVRHNMVDKKKADQELSSGRRDEKWPVVVMFVRNCITETEICFVFAHRGGSYIHNPKQQNKVDLKFRELAVSIKTVG